VDMLFDETLFDDTEHTPVGFLLDAAHVYCGGSDVITLIKRRLERIAAFDMRDFVNDKEVSPGQGNFPRAQFAAVLRGRALDEKDNDGGQ
jgi:sugar phosphate isomerase/epimerase